MAENPLFAVAIPKRFTRSWVEFCKQGHPSGKFETDLWQAEPWVDHRTPGCDGVPGAAYLEMAVRGFAASQGHDWAPAQLRDVGFERPLVLGYGKSAKVTLSLQTRSTNGKAESNFAINDHGDGTAGPYCRGRVSNANGDIEKVAVQDLLARINAKQQSRVSLTATCASSALNMVRASDHPRPLGLGAPNSGEAVARVTASPRSNGAELHPFAYSTVLDGSFQVFGAALRTLPTSDRPGTYVPRSIKLVALRNLPAPEVWSHATVRVTGDGRSLVARIRAMTAGGDIVADIEDMESRPLGKLTLSRGQTGQQADAERVTETREHLFERLLPMPRCARVDRYVGLARCRSEGHSGRRCGGNRSRQS